MKLTLTYKKALALAVLAYLEQRNEGMKGWKLEEYDNGREQGFAIQAKSWKVAFSEHRSSDNIVVYRGLVEDFGRQNIPSEQVWQNAKYFQYEEAAKAALCIEDYLQPSEMR